MSAVTLILIDCGSSPHTRGARHKQRLRVRRARIIPAYAGSTHPHGRMRPVGGDHPRIRGEHKDEEKTATIEGGSSPHTRGALVESLLSVDDNGIIPAYAGSTTGRTGWRPLVRDHPRIRGEHRGERTVDSSSRGSSPHTRGALPRPEWEFYRSRIIPAYAGSTQVRGGHEGVYGDHPRIRGEHEEAVDWLLRVPGSSPHTRGARARPASDVNLPGIIPAYAGSTTLPDPNRKVGEDHPRIRGEHSKNPGAPMGGRGSSPHTRGAPSAGDHGPARRRIIPAYAGST